ncbi:MAG: 4-(cytidine 5'-diphospho)-2-C-methyl-D-erythritol kinase [Candidatus Eremiobacteraeota bacterium]|nr:4-(cytidine 5'-diphospho)-2-C-methyl-D-erythritol kinase [Candidatus Eremiobacteraeota bacterium]
MPTLFAPAKINATLEVLTRRSDGYHTLRSVMLPIGLYDRIELRAAHRGTFSASDAALVSDNLVSRALAAAELADRFDVVLQKEIPVGGGLGGGSSDAAAVLRAAMNGELGERVELDWLAAAARLGSDVPFFLGGTAALVEGTGERVTPLGALPAWWVVIVRPSTAVATPDAYRLLDESRERSGAPQSRPRAASASLAAVDALQRADFAAFLSALGNDFHDVICASHPEVAQAAAALLAAGASRALLSGSGSCLFAPCELESQARDIGRRLAPCDAIESVFAVPLHHDDAWR